jgi:hypothetical protein
MLQAIFVLYFCRKASSASRLVVAYRVVVKGEAMANEEQSAILKQGVEVWSMRH